MTWADNYIAELEKGKIIQFRPRGNSMSPRIKSGQLVTVEPLDINKNDIKLWDVVLCRVGRKVYLHYVGAMNKDSVQIQNHKGFVNGWTDRRNVYGKVTRVES